MVITKYNRFLTLKTWKQLLNVFKNILEIKTIYKKKCIYEQFFNIP